jgi:Transcriptional regulator, AbiEi antitoxin
MDRRRADASIAEIAAIQYGVFSRAQAREAGLSDRQLRWRIAKGVVERLSLHTFRIAGCPPSWRQKVMIACLAAGVGAAASHRTAAALHRFDGFATGIIEITVPQSRRDFKMEGVIVHSSSYWGDDDVTTVAGIPVSTPERTLCTLAAVCADGQVESALDSAERDDKVRRAAVIEVHSDVRERGVNGVAALARILDRRAELAGIPQSVLERRMLNLLEQHGLPLPACQVPVRRADGRMAYLDFAYRDLGLGIEVDGNLAHATPSQRAADNMRGNAILLRDIRLLRFTYEQVTYEPEMVATTVRSHLRARRAA